MRILVFGTFDLFHPGHHFLLSEASGRGDLSVVVARDRNVEHIKGRAPVQDEQMRAETIRKTFPSANVLLGDSDDFLVPVRTIHPDLILLGYDQKLPPGVQESDLPCAVERLPAFRPEIYKSSRMRKQQNGG